MILPAVCVFQHFSLFLTLSSIILPLSLFFSLSFSFFFAVVVVVVVNFLFNDKKFLLSSVNILMQH